MIVVEASADVGASAETVLALVMDVDRYRTVDHKIRKVLDVERDGDTAVVKMRTRMRGVTVPAAQRMALVPGERIDVNNLPGPQDRFVAFHGEFVCSPAPAGTRITHRYTFDFKGPARIMEPLLRNWLQRDILEEVQRIREHFAAD